MCGIAGVVIPSEDRGLGIVRGMIDKLTHRGPDGEGIWHESNFTLGHKRLSIIDPEAGQQPFSYKDKYAITYNGELYNFLELKEELISAGFHFETHCDTEVILYSYVAWGEHCVNRFRGMFAFAIADLVKKELFLSRDHIGIKPLYYAEQNGIFAFGSELQALKAAQELRFEIDPEALDDYLWLQYIPAPKTIFKQVRKLPPGHFLRVTADGNVVSKKRYWNFSYKADYNLTYNDWVEETESVIKASVKKHLISDVPFGAFLSGGVDSSLIVTYMSQMMDKPVDTFSIGFEDQSFSELHYAETVAKQCRTNHHVEIVKAEGLDILPKIVSHYGEPFGDSSAIPTYYVCKMASNKVKMVLSGDGGDEAFLGYESYQRFYQGQSYEDIPHWKRLMYPVGRSMFPSKYLDREKYTYWVDINRYLPFSWRNRLWRNEYNQFTRFENETFEKLFVESGSADLIQKAQYADLHTYLPFDILTKVDVASMMNSLEVRTPLVDKELWELIARIPSDHHFQNGRNTWNGKRILKSLLMKYYSNDFVNRPKMGFSVPINQWMGFKNGNSSEMAHLFNRNSLILEYFNEKEVQNVLKNGWGKWKWLLLFLEFWLKDFNSK